LGMHNTRGNKSMKSILLTTTAIVAFAGAAAADGHAGIGFAGDATLGYNTDENGTGDNDGFYWGVGMDVTMTAALDNGVTATVDFGIGIVDTDTVNTNGNDLDADDYVLKLATENASLSFGTVDPVAEANWGGVDGDTTVGFNDIDVHTGAGFDAILAAEVTMSGVTAMMSVGVGAQGYEPIDSDIDAYQFYVTGDFGQVSAEVAYQAELGGADAVMGVSASTSVAGADLTAAYLTDGTETSMGLAVSYPVAPGVTVGGYYSLNDVAEDAFGVSADYADGPIAVNAFYDFAGGASDADGDDSSEFGVEGSYDTGLGATILAGFISNTAGTADATTTSYIAGTYDLGGGASVLVSYAMDDDNTAGDEVGDPEYQVGTTVEVSFSF